jgi:hypothetical protein
MQTKTKNNTLYLTIVLIQMLAIAHCISFSDLQSKVLSTDNKPTDSSTIPSSRQQDTCSKDSLDDLNKKFDNTECDLISDGPICLFNGDRVLLPFATPKGLVGYWNFDEIRPLDNSGNRNHGAGVVKPGPAFGGFGSSAQFTGGEYVTVPFTPAFQSSDFSVTFWLFVVQDFFTSSKGIRYCPLVQRGNDDLFAKNYHRSPALYYDRKEKNLKFYVKTNSDDASQGESLLSNARITTQRWMHIAIIKSDNKLKLYVNGILDNSSILKATAETTNSPLYIGNVPWLKDQCDFPFLIDEMRYYNIAVSEDTIQAEASPVLGGIEPSFLQLGCMNCSLKDASQACVDGYRLCTSIELHTGGYQIARSMGWLNWNTHIWTHGALKTPGDFDKLKGLALCCAELK